MECKWVSALEKVFADGRGTEGMMPPVSALRGECVSFQVAVKNAPEKQDVAGQFYTLRIDSPLAGCASIRQVQSVPVKLAFAPEKADEHYLSLLPGLYPDVLTDLRGEYLSFAYGPWHSLWIELTIPEDAPAGSHPFALTFLTLDGHEAARLETEITIIPAVLPPQETVHTEWFHADCLADYYQVPVFSQAHWEIMERFIRTAVKRGCTMLLTPHITPALDTRIGGERTTVQLVDIEARGTEYVFDFTRLKRWMDMALACGISQFEFAHLFTQWGAKAAPKIMVRENGVLTRRFGWDTPAVGGEYTRFLHAYLPALTAQLRAWGLADRCCFHISDEPHMDTLESYRQAKASVNDLLAGFKIMDALSDHAIYCQAELPMPVVCINHMQEFWQEQVYPQWTYYCSTPTKEYPNRLMQMPLARTRALGLMLWKYRIHGFLHWGFNYYNSIDSVQQIDPFLETEAYSTFFPAGDSFVVYPGRDGNAQESIRLLALHGAFQDIRALTLLERLTSREYAQSVLEAEGEITLTHFPCDGNALLAIRQRINDAIASYTTGGCKNVPGKIE